MMSQVALFRIGDEPFAVAGDAIGHIVVMPPLFQVPLLCPEIFGVFVRSGEPAYLLDLLKIFDLPFELTLEMAEHTLICPSEAGLIGLPATQLERIVSVDAGSLEEMDRDSFSRLSYNFTFDDRKYQLVDVATLVASLLR
jgi:chemotaxis signal transduction protein